MNVSQSIKSNQEISTNIFTKYEEGLSLFISDIIKDTLVDRKMKKAELLRHAQTAEALWRKLSPMVDNCGSFDFTPLKHSLLWRLDLKEDSHRRRLKTLPNHNGSTHSNAVRSNPEQLAMEHKSSFDPNLLLSPLPTDEDRLTDERVGDEEGDMIIENKETPQVSLDCSMIFLSYVLPGTLSFTKQHFTFTADDSSTECNKVSQICDYCPLSDQWLLLSVTAVFSRYYIHQFKALEIFFNDKSSIFIVLKSPSDRKTVINLLPKVGIGPNYGLPQT
ncbi:PREDICTED: lipopolysaccharide-responsive and beige-like anchor protein, partial [Amphimedon queenslandica]